MPNTGDAMTAAGACWAPRAVALVDQPAELGTSVVGLARIAAGAPVRICTGDGSGTAPHSSGRLEGSEQPKEAAVGATTSAKSRRVSKRTKRPSRPPAEAHWFELASAGVVWGRRMKGSPELLTPELEARIDRYRPAWAAADLVLWDEVVGDLVRAAVKLLIPGGMSNGFEQVRYLAGFVRDVYKRRRVVDLNKICIPHEVDWWVFAKNADRSDEWKHAAASYLKRACPIVAPPAPWPAEGPKLVGARVMRPYSTDEERAFALKATSSTGVRRRRLLAAAGGAFGAGLDGRSLPWVETDDLIDLPNGRLAIHVRRPYERLVPVRASYSAMLLEAAESVGDGPLLRGSLRSAGLNRRWVQMSDAWKGLEVRNLGPIVPGRARATWIAAHLRNNTPLSTLLAISGASSRYLAEIASLLAQVPDEEGFAKALDA